MTFKLENLNGTNQIGESVPGKCPHCEYQTTLQVAVHEALTGSSTWQSSEKTVARFLLRLDCDWCHESSAYIQLANCTRVVRHGGYARALETLSLNQIHPEQTPRQLAPEAPEAVREVFAEASLAEAAGAFRLAGIGYRATVEQIVKDKAAAGKNLYERITSLAAMGVTQDIVDAFHEARFVGNDAAHDALAYSADEIADIAELVNEAVLVLYVQPAQRARMAQQRAARRAAAKQAASQSGP
ncbi:DUF4145 domain-containing protein [Streptomyces althioticus]